MHATRSVDTTRPVHATRPVDTTRPVHATRPVDDTRPVHATLPEGDTPPEENTRSVDDRRHVETARRVEGGGPVDAGVLTPAPRLAGIAFAELGVDSGTGPELESLLRGLGFAHTGQHRSKAVQLWEQGAARILLNYGAPRLAEGSAAIRAFALESADPAASAKRAAELLAEPLPRRRRWREAEMTAVAAPDGTEVFFCRGDHAWLGDFLPTGETATGRTVRAIDHLSLAQPFDRYDEAALFYRSVLGMTDDEAGEFAAPYGLMRTLAVRNEDRSVRLSLSVPLLRRGDWAPAVPHPQHITLLTDDITLVEDTVPIPRNYLDDLAARGTTAVDALYDEDAHGYYLQRFTPVIGRRVFFEVVQRVGGYRGYGFVNDPVRMAAHRAQRQAAPPPTSSPRQSDPR
ncbi:hypothetical protein JIG36_22380 [Actinoplanes sp. LDG1-06]|uniref:4-hydroxyphenylpyruvate dioxygenase n=2 Tax=Paractinoplanes ovalisporus TaxID=2810368 RepID=A0ABS2AEP4_9ACTN|nr:hypothetical protein [Actinoplanes ovalisporus]